MNSKELVLKTLEGKNYDRVPRQLWTLPWAVNRYYEYIKKMSEDFPDDILEIDAKYKQTSLKVKGNAYEIGEYIDDWGCTFENIQRGIIGEVKKPLIYDDEWEDIEKIHIPEELLSFNIDKVNEDILKISDKFIRAEACPHPFEQLQFIRGTEKFYMDLMYKPKKMLEFIEKMHDFYCRLLKKWAKTNVDTLVMMDDWGCQKSLLINPLLWEEIFSPMYRDYIDIAHKAGKKMFMHSDGYILPIIPKLIDMGLDAINCQIFCIGIDKLKQFKGKITFWGDIDRQYLLYRGSREEIFNAVKQVKENLWDNGYCIAQCDLGVGAKPENVYAVFEAWDLLENKITSTL